MANPVRASNDVEFNPDSAFLAAISIAKFCLSAPAFGPTPIWTNESPVYCARSPGGACPSVRFAQEPIALADAGLLNDYRCTIHWENIESLAERYPRLNITATLFEADRNRFTCSGGMAALDMMIHSIRQDYGRELGMAVADQMLYTSIREPQDLQRMAIEQRTGISHPKLLAAIGYMEAYLESTISMRDLAKKCRAVAKAGGTAVSRTSGPDADKVLS